MQKWRRIRILGEGPDRYEFSFGDDRLENTPVRAVQKITVQVVTHVNSAAPIIMEAVWPMKRAHNSRLPA